MAERRRKPAERMTPAEIAGALDQARNWLAHALDPPLASGAERSAAVERIKQRLDAMNANELRAEAAALLNDPSGMRQAARLALPYLDQIERTN